MLLLIADRQPCALRSVMPGDAEEITFLEITSDRFPSELVGFLRNRELELAVIECVYGEKRGLMLLDGIKRRRPDVPVLFVCAGGSDRAEREALALGARECFQNPVDVPRFRERVRTLRRLKCSSWEQRMPLPAPETGHGGPDKLRSDIPYAILRAVCYVEDHLAERKLSVSRLARLAGMSPFHFCRVFKRHMARSPMQYVALMRVNKSQEFLRDNPGSISISRIATAVGFYDASNFNRHFKKFTGTTPSAFRRTLSLSKAG